MSKKSKKFIVSSIILAGVAALFYVQHEKIVKEESMLKKSREIIISCIILILAGTVAFLYAYHEQRLIENKLRMQQPKECTVQVKGVEENATSIPTISSYYDPSQMANHYPLTISNVIWFTNYYRLQNGLSALGENTQLDGSADAKNTDMVTYQYFEHTRPGSTVGFNYFIIQQGYQFVKIGENLAMGDFTTSKQVADAWMASPPHRKNLLDPAYKEVGISINSSANIKGANVVLITQHFGEPLSACPTVDSSMKTQIDNLNIQIQNLQKSMASKESSVGGQPTDPTSLKYNGLVSNYNGLINSYNSDVSQMGNLVKTYNQQVNSFDQCINNAT